MKVLWICMFSTEYLLYNLWHLLLNSSILNTICNINYLSCKQPHLIQLLISWKYISLYIPKNMWKYFQLYNSKNCLVLTVLLFSVDIDSSTCVHLGLYCWFRFCGYWQQNMCTLRFILLIQVLWILTALHMITIRFVLLIQVLWILTAELVYT